MASDRDKSILERQSFTVRLDYRADEKVSTCAPVASARFPQHDRFSAFHSEALCGWVVSAIGDVTPTDGAGWVGRTRNNRARNQCFSLV